MKLTVLGSSDAFNSAGRAHSAYWIDDANGAWAVDFGPTTIRQCKALGRDPTELDAVFLTHLHGDHSGGLAILLVDQQYRAGRTRPLVIGGPPGTEERLYQLRRSAYPEMLDRGLSFPLHYAIWTVPGEAVVGSRRVRAIRARHEKRDISSSLRIEADGRALCFTGDTGWFDDLVDLSADTDVCVCECTSVASPYDGHINLNELRAIREQISTRRLVLTHFDEEMRALALVPGAPAFAEIRAQAAEDGLVLTI